MERVEWTHTQAQNAASAKPTAGVHALSMTDRKRTEIRGVRSVISFDDGAVVLSTEQGELSVEGSGFCMDTLDMEHGIVIFTGTVNGLFYVTDRDASEREKKGFFGRLLR